MQAATPQGHKAEQTHRTHPVPDLREVRANAFPRVTDALRAVESLLLSSGQRTARRNAWTSVLEDRRRARDRVEAQHVLEAVAGRTSRAT
ncbi:SCO2195 family GlnR-regulated protein [Streptomyces sp. NPDC000229]|uniref:SCO2195 family GlnR-regulated protein n=1 Tax=Streptomyces sp. NPDC000229 TaxID=3154247 RepID=UPI003334396A